MTVATAPADLPEIDLAQVDPLAIAQEIVNIRRTISHQQERLEKGMALLNRCYAEGVVPKEFQAADCSFLLVAGRTSYDWASVPEVKAAEASLKVAKDQAKKDGTVPTTVGAPSWRISEAKPSH
jgi:hypothetical protein